MSDLRHASARLLVVDDNKVNRLLLTRSLELQGHEVGSAENGRIALELLRGDAFDLMLLDMEMPEMDGFQVLEELARDPKLRDLPVIVTSSLEGVANIARCIELGAEDYLQKPVNAVLLKARIGASLEKKRLRDQQKEMVRRFATSEVAQDLQQSGFALGGRRVQGTVMFCDIRSFTTLVESQPPEETIELLNAYYALMFEAINNEGGVVNQMIGDGLMAIFGAPLPLADHGASAVRAALEMVDMVELLNAERAAVGKSAIRIGVGVATGEMVAGYTGTQQRATYTCIGDTVNLAARLESHTKEAQRTILIDAATEAALAGRMTVESLGDAAIRGKALPVPIWAVTGPRSKSG
ncbi:adenylate/guanylate cyclase domain-containing response regulator [Variovorax sp. J22P168]|uniref:adenylate/guanylate cyclase domain-containing protein n=1 Tax=Variovorax jilinensis TaxID=3053513 RepID=UPI00257852D8|nr:adenylate/guanylate cyclase domain-containing response regulator [Variovorax sp. J22P168]MDM0013005.1 adenylate/guanylate cyclase domain-containing response regulator [Variovorax sp. J22P168]